MTIAAEDRKELRVRIEAIHHHKLVALKVLRKKTMADAIHEALVHYFEHVLPDIVATRDDADAVVIRG